MLTTAFVQNHIETRKLIDIENNAQPLPSPTGGVMADGHNTNSNLLNTASAAIKEILTPVLVENAKS